MAARKPLRDQKAEDRQGKRLVIVCASRRLPIAALLFVPLALLTGRDANLLFSFGTLGLLVLVLTLVLREFTGLRGRQLVLGCLAAGAIGFWLGQLEGQPVIAMDKGAHLLDGLDPAKIVFAWGGDFKP